MGSERTFLTTPAQFRNVSRGTPRPHDLKGDDLVRARLTPETWRLEIMADPGTSIQTPLTLEKRNAIDLPTLEKLGRQHGRKFLKAMQCLNIPQPLGQGLWEGVPLREVIKLAGRINNLRRIYYWGFHNNDEKQIFQSSLSYTQAFDMAPGEIGPLVVYKLNGQPISLERGGPVRMVIPWSYGFKSIKWLQRIVLTNEYKAMDTYGLQNNDPESFLKTAAYIDGNDVQSRAGMGVTMTGTVMVGLPGFRRVEYWVRPDNGTHGRIDDNDPAWGTARWQPCTILPPPKDWGGTLPEGVLPRDVWGFDPKTGQPREWPMRYSWGLWTVTTDKLAAGSYEFRVRTVDANGFAQPEPRPYAKSGRNDIQHRLITVM